VIRTLLWLLAGLMLGGIVHIAVILMVPRFASNDTWSRVEALDALDRIVVLPPAVAGAPNPFGLDPELAYAVCRINLAAGPGEVSGALPRAFWSVAVYDRGGTVIYSTANRDGASNQLDLGIFNPAQTRLLAQQQLDVAEGLLIVESQSDDVFVLVRLAPPHEVMRPRYEAMLADLVCGNIG
jgi:uncharacterized membrane protein